MAHVEQGITKPESWVPCVFDDGDIVGQRLVPIRAFLDPTEIATYARWGGCKSHRAGERDSAAKSESVSYATLQANEPSGVVVGEAAPTVDSDGTPPLLPADEEVEKYQASDVAENFMEANEAALEIADSIAPRATTALV